MVLNNSWEWPNMQYTMAHIIGESWSQNYSQIHNSFPNSFFLCLHATLVNWSRYASWSVELQAGPRNQDISQEFHLCQANVLLLVCHTFEAFSEDDVSFPGVDESQKPLVTPCCVGLTWLISWGGRTIGEKKKKETHLSFLLVNSSSQTEAVCLCRNQMQSAGKLSHVA